MTPFSVQKLLINMSDFNHIKSNIVSSKFSFCTEFEKEMNISQGYFSESIFNYVFSLFVLKEAFCKTNKELIFKQYIEDFEEWNFTNSIEVSDNINKRYKKIVIISKEYMLHMLKMNNDDSDYISRKFESDKVKNFEILKGMYT